MKTGFAATLCVSIALGLAAAPGAHAQTLYKLIDKNGKITYAEKPPKDFDGKVIRLDIDPNANTATLPKPSAQPAPGAAARAESEDRVKAARERLEAARKAYDQAVNSPGDGDVTFMGNKGGGTRPVFTDAYAKRLAGLEQAVKDAEEELKRAQGG
jgi:hypothetical protein